MHRGPCKGPDSRTREIKTIVHGLLAASGGLDAVDPCLPFRSMEDSHPMADQAAGDAANALGKMVSTS